MTYVAQRLKIHDTLRVTDIQPLVTGPKGETFGQRWHFERPVEVEGVMGDFSRTYMGNMRQGFLRQLERHKLIVASPTVAAPSFWMNRVFPKQTFSTGLQIPDFDESEWPHYDLPYLNGMALAAHSDGGFRMPTRFATVEALTRALTDIDVVQLLAGLKELPHEKLLPADIDLGRFPNPNLLLEEFIDAVLGQLLQGGLRDFLSLSAAVFIEESYRSDGERRGGSLAYHPARQVAAHVIEAIDASLGRLIASGEFLKFFEMDWQVEEGAAIFSVGCQESALGPQSLLHWKSRSVPTGKHEDKNLYRYGRLSI